MPAVLSVLAVRHRHLGVLLRETLASTSLPALRTRAPKLDPADFTGPAEYSCNLVATPYQSAERV